MSRKIMVIDDLATQRTAMKYVLSGMGYLVIEADNGQIALNLLEQDPAVDAIIADYRMPKLDGLTLLQKVKNIPSFQSIPILILLMESQLQYKEQIREAGATGWLLKPWQPEQLGTVIRKIVPLS